MQFEREVQMKFSKKITRTIIAAVTAFAMMGTAAAVDVHAGTIGTDDVILPGSNTVTINNCEAGKEYVVSVITGSYSKHPVTAGSVKYIDQKKATGSSVDFSFNIKGTDRAVVMLSSNDENADYPIIIGEVYIPISEAQISFTSYTYDGKTKYAKLEGATYRGESLGTDTVLKYSGSGVNVGTYKVPVSVPEPDKSRFTGSTYGIFKINPVGTKLKSLSRGKKSMTVKWAKPSSKYKKQITGYQIQYSLYSNFNSSKTATAKYSSKSKKISGLAKKKRYYVRIRTYKNGCYSAWSAEKSVVTK